MLRRILITGLLGLLSVAGHAQTKITLKVFFGGGDAGENTSTWNADGTFESKTTLNIAGQKIESPLTGKHDKGKISEYTLEESRNGTTSKVVVKGGKIIAFAGGIEKGKQDLKTKAMAFMGNIHPQTLRTVFAALKKTDIPGGQKITLLFLDSAGDLEVTVTPKSVRTAMFEGSEKPITPILLKIGAAEVEYVMGPEGGILGMSVPTQQLEMIAEGWTGLFVDPVAKYKELSQPSHKVRIERGAKIPMRDGINLVADIYRPEGDGKYPVILSRTPYGRDTNAGTANWFTKRGYIFITQDVRGREDSEGAWNPFMPERKDGFDTIDWIAKQSWCTGSVGMIGASYGGMVQWAAAVEQHPALKCIIPQVSPPDAFFNIPYDHGVPMLWAGLWWLQIVKDKKTNMGSGFQPLPHPAKFTTLPLTMVDNAVIGTNFPHWDTWMKQEKPSQFSGFDWLPAVSKVKIPALHISGWFDGDGIGTKLNYAQARKNGNNNQWLIYGPWTHFFNTTTSLGDVNFGAHAIMELDSIYLRWFDTWLKGMDVKVKALPKVQVFVTGKNEWRNLNDWPDARSKTSVLYLSAKGTVAGPKTTGLLGAKTTSAPKSYTYNPAKETVPKAMLNVSAATEPSLKAEIPNGTDYAYFRTAPMKQNMEIGGPIELDLFFSTSAKDTDFFATVVDIHPNGVAYGIGIPGKIRARYLYGWETPKTLTPGKTYNAKIAIWDVAHCFKPGHRLGLVITSSAFPMYARNLGTGEPNATATKMVNQKQTIYMDAKRPSALRFRILPPGR